jgi:hypothetical protein
MKQRWLIAFLVAGVVAIVGVGLRYLHCSDHMYSRYATLADAAAKGAVRRGWIPSFVPPTASDLYEEHDIDRNQVWLRFTVNPTDPSLALAAFTPLSLDAVRNLTVQPPCSSGWWFEGFIEQQPENDGALHADVYQGPGLLDSQVGYIAIDRTAGHVFFWTLARGAV